MGTGMMAALRIGSLLLCIGSPVVFRWHIPTASFTTTPTSGPPPLSVDVDASASVGAHGPIVSYSWDWGDGSAAGSTVTASHIYASTGTYFIRLTVTESTGLTAASTTRVDCITAGNSPPTATIDSSPSVTGAAPLDVSFVGHGTDSAGLLEHRWTFGDGTADGVFTGLASGQTSTPLHTYSSPGTYQVTLSVKDDEGILATAAAVVSVTTAGIPFASFTLSAASGPPPFQVDSDGTASFDTDGIITKYDWDWGDGTPATSGANSTHVYAATGTYTIRLTVTDSSALTASTEKSVNCISVGNLPPSSVIISAIPQTGPFPMNTAFVGFGHDDVGTLEHRWDFGDGSAPLVFPSVANHATTTPSHVYTLAGTYVCTLRIKDAENITATSSITVTVVDPVANPVKRGGGVCGATGVEPLLFLLVLWRRRRRASR